MSYLLLPVFFFTIFFEYILSINVKSTSSNINIKNPLHVEKVLIVGGVDIPESIERLITYENERIVGYFAYTNCGTGGKVEIVVRCNPGRYMDIYASITPGSQMMGIRNNGNWINDFCGGWDTACNLPTSPPSSGEFYDKQGILCFDMDSKEFFISERIGIYSEDTLPCNEVDGRSYFSYPWLYFQVTGTGSHIVPMIRTSLITTEVNGCTCATLVSF